MLALICTLASCSFGFSPEESGGTEGIIYGFSDDGTYAMVLGYEGTEAEIEIAKSYNGLPVRCIVSRAFSGSKKITSVIIPGSVTSIGDEAFSDCSVLASVTIPDSVTSIGDEAFYGCTSSVYITDIEKWCNISFDSVSSNPLFYYGNLYLNEELATNLVIPDSVTSIGDGAFLGCSSLTSVKFNNTDGWYAYDPEDSNATVIISSTDLSDSSTVATYLKSTYTSYYWKRT